MKNSNFIFGLLFSIVLLLTLTLNLFAQQQRYQGEIMVSVCGMTGQDKKWTVTATALSSTRWHILNDQCYITTGYSSASVSGEGNDGMPNGFRCPCQHVEHGEDLAFSEYRFSWDLPAPHSDPDPISLDLKDADWACNYAESDITIRYNIDSSKYEVRIGGAGNSFHELEEDTIWDILDESPPNQTAFQPTEPRNLSCTNPNQKGAHPNLSWTGCEWPGVRSLTVYFRVFRNDSEVASGSTTEAWTDEDVIIHGGGDELTYVVKAYLSDSSDSDPSNSVVINGRMAKKLPGEEFPTFDEEKSTNEAHLFSISTFPNPFNPTTTISYFVPMQRHIHISVYNIYGQKVADLVNRNHAMGEYKAIFNGDTLAGGIYFIWLKSGEFHLLRKVLLLR